MGAQVHVRRAWQRVPIDDQDQVDDEEQAERDAQDEGRTQGLASPAIPPWPCEHEGRGGDEPRREPSEGGEAQSLPRGIQHRQQRVPVEQDGLPRHGEQARAHEQRVRVATAAVAGEADGAGRQAERRQDPVVRRLAVGRPMRVHADGGDPGHGDDQAGDHEQGGARIARALHPPSVWPGVGRSCSWRLPTNTCDRGRGTSRHRHRERTPRPPGSWSRARSRKPWRASAVSR